MDLNLSRDLVGVLLQKIKGCQTLYLVIFFMEEDTRVYPDIPTSVEALTMYFSAAQSAVLPPLIEGEFLCISVVLLVNS